MVGAYLTPLTHRDDETKILGLVRRQRKVSLLEHFDAFHVAC